MINIYSTHPTSSFVMYPDDPFVQSPTGSFELELIQDYDQTTYRVENITRLNTTVANNKSHVLVLQFRSGSEAVASRPIPQNDGQYTAKLYFGVETPTTWGGTHYLFGSYHEQWGDIDTFSGSLVSTDRAYVHGANLQTITTYTGTDQTGAYTTYNS